MKSILARPNPGINTTYATPCLCPRRNVCLWDTLVSPGNSMVHGKRSFIPPLCVLGLFSAAVVAVQLLPKSHLLLLSSR